MAHGVKRRERGSTQTWATFLAIFTPYAIQASAVVKPETFLVMIFKLYA